MTPENKPCWKMPIAIYEPYSPENSAILRSCIFNNFNPAGLILDALLHDYDCPATSLIDIFILA